VHFEKYIKELITFLKIVLSKGLLLSDIILSPIHGVFLFFVLSMFNLYNILFIKFFCKIIYELFSFFTSIPNMYSIGLHLIYF